MKESSLKKVTFAIEVCLVYNMNYICNYAKAALLKK